MPSLKDKTVLVIGRGGGLARAVALAAAEAGAQVVAAGRDTEALTAAYAAEPAVTTEMVDLTDEASIAALGERLGTMDHVVSTASARARGRVAELDRDALRLSFDTKVIGPLMLAKHLAPRVNEGGSFVIFSGVAAAKIAVGTLGVAITNAAADTVARSLALELAPIRGQRDLPRRGRHRRVGRLRPPRQGRLLRPDRRPQSRPPHRYSRGHRPGRPVRHDQHVPDRPGPAHRRRRTAHLKGTTMNLAGSKGRSPRKGSAGSSVSAVQADAIFLSGLPRRDEPTIGQVRQAVVAAIRAFGCSGWTGRVAQEFGDHPETAVIRMRWARGMAREAFADPAPGQEPVAGAVADGWLVIRLRLPAEQTSGTPGVGRREPAQSAAASEA
jgi:NADP-dependent 3-hydroxy acid dehydrogenase YdfG